MPPCKAWRYQCQSILLLSNIKLVELIAYNVPFDHITLEEDFPLRAEVCMTLLPKLFDNNTQEAISYFRVKITNVIKSMDHIYYYYSWFVHLIELNLIFDKAPILTVVLETNIIYHYDRNIFGYSKTFNICYDYWNQINRGSEPKFGISNKMPLLYC